MLRALPILLALCLPAVPALAQAALPDGVVQVDILPGWQTDRGTRMAAIRFRLAPGWKTYWRAPGEAGIPPLFTFDGSQNVAAAAFHWPVPQVFEQSGMQSIGYLDEVVIPVEVTPADAEAPARLAGRVEFGICDEICVPVEARFDAELPVDGRRDPAIAAALIDQPMTAAGAGAGTVTCALAPEGRGLTLTARLPLPPTGGQEVVVVESGDPGLWVSPAQVTRQGDVLVASAELLPTGSGAVAVDRSALRFTVLGADRAVDITGCAAG
jgi:DsbC/DsbD-like thiol-disulfide interchange protein